MSEEISKHPKYSLSNPKPLPLRLTRRGFIYTQLLAESGYYLYEQRVQESGLIVGYELFREKTKPETNFKGKVFPPKIMWPHDEAFGSWAWSFYSLEKAKTKFLELTKYNYHGKAI